MFTDDVFSTIHAHSQILEKNMQLMMTSVESLQQETYRLLGYEKNLAKQTQLKQQFLAKRVRAWLLGVLYLGVIIYSLSDWTLLSFDQGWLGVLCLGGGGNKFALPWPWLLLYWTSFDMQIHFIDILIQSTFKVTLVKHFN